MKSDHRIAFVLDALPAVGGAEKVLFTALEAYPQADVFTLIYNRPAFRGTPIANRHIHTPYLDRLHFVRKHHRLFLPLMLRAVERLDLREYDVIVSFTYAVAHGIHNPNRVRHIAYTYTPMRYAWTGMNLDGTPTRKNWLIQRFMDSFRTWDRQAAARVHDFAAISEAVACRIKNAWGRKSHLIYPPVETDRFQPFHLRGDYFITVSRLVPHKRIDLLVRAFSQLQLPLIVVGDGPEFSHLNALASSNVHLTGFLPDERTAELIMKSRAFVCAAEEDFGIAMVEAQAAGCPVIAYGRGGALEIVADGVTGLFFEEQTVESVMEAVRRFEAQADSFCRQDLVRNASRFGKDRFVREFVQFVEGKDEFSEAG
jgi:glycosyltransferase involved in cell wall biosynthesis